MAKEDSFLLELLQYLDRRWCRFDHVSRRICNVCPFKLFFDKNVGFARVKFRRGVLYMCRRD